MIQAQKRVQGHLGEQLRLSAKQINQTLNRNRDGYRARVKTGKGDGDGNMSDMTGQISIAACQNICRHGPVLLQTPISRRRVLWP